jgi:hypothetical protein
MSVSTDDLETEIDPDNECYCDFVQFLEEDGERVELHHVIPDDGAPHTNDTDCGCNPVFQRLETDLVVVEHHDQDRASDVYYEDFLDEDD